MTQIEATLNLKFEYPCEHINFLAKLKLFFFFSIYVKAIPTLISGYKDIAKASVMISDSYAFWGSKSVL